jgi:hypothetical protein
LRDAACGRDPSRATPRTAGDPLYPNHPLRGILI